MTSVRDLLTGYGYKSYVLCGALVVVGCGRGLPRRLCRGRAAAVTLGALALAVLTLGGTARAADETRAVHMRLGTHEEARGRADAPITIIEFTDYQCPYCRRFQTEAWPRLKRKYVDSGKVRFIVRDLPLEFHSAARPAAEVAHCAAEQGKFWPMHEALLRNSTQLNDTYVIELAREMGLDVLRLRACAMGDRYEGAIARNAAEAAALGIHGTPTFVIGRTAEGELDGVRVAGALPYEQFAAYLYQLLPER
jgi:protein-disulfide isomerase